MMIGLTEKLILQYMPLYGQTFHPYSTWLVDIKFNWFIYDNPEYNMANHLFTKKNRDLH